MPQYSKEFLHKTIEIWSPDSPQHLNTEDAEQIIMNTVELYEYLHKLNQKYNDAKKI